MATFERYVSLLMGGGLELEYETRGRLVLVRGVDYKAVRMFQLSILWRAAVSSLPFFFQLPRDHTRRRSGSSSTLIIPVRHGGTPVSCSRSFMKVGFKTT